MVFESLFHSQKSSNPFPASFLISVGGRGISVTILSPFPNLPETNDVPMLGIPPAAVSASDPSGLNLSSRWSRRRVALPFSKGVAGTE